MNVLAELTTCCNEALGAVLLWKLRIIRLQLQFFFRRRVGINDCNVTLQSYWNLFWQNTICNSFVSNGTCDSSSMCLSTSLFFASFLFLRLLESHFLEPLLRTFLRTLQNPLQDTFYEPFLQPSRKQRR